MAYDSISKKMNQWVTNKQRPPTCKKAKRARSRVPQAKSDDDTLDDHGEDYDEIVKGFKLSAQDSNVEYIDLIEEISVDDNEVIDGSMTLDDPIDDPIDE